mmetsp:Transcript_9683/g.29425  ORF Transcript_9683/g.29425 Transcript_9683/m.29425 type:complete len:213 (-) Transcript_9683:279-917(-)
MTLVSNSLTISANSSCARIIGYPLSLNPATLPDSRALVKYSRVNSTAAVIFSVYFGTFRGSNWSSSMYTSGCCPKIDMSAVLPVCEDITMRNVLAGGSWAAQTGIRCESIEKSSIFVKSVLAVSAVEPSPEAGRAEPSSLVMRLVAGTGFTSSFSGASAWRAEPGSLVMKLVAGTGFTSSFSGASAWKTSSMSTAISCSAAGWSSPADLTRS